MSGTGAAFIQGTGAAFVQGVGAARGGTPDPDAGNSVWWAEVTGTTDHIGENTAFSTTVLNTLNQGSTYCEGVSIDTVDTYGTQHGASGNTFYRWSGQVTSTVKATTGLTSKSDQGVSYADGDLVTADGTRLYRFNGFSTTVADSANVGSGKGPTDPECDDTDVTVYHNIGFDVVLYSGQVSTTVLSSFSSSPHNQWGTGFDGTDTIFNSTAGKLIRYSGQVSSSTIKRSLSWNTDSFTRIYISWGSYTDRDV